MRMLPGMTHLQIRNVPADVHRKLKARAAHAGQSLSEYALGELTQSVERPTRSELLKRLASRPPASVGEPAVDAVRAERVAR